MRVLSSLFRRDQDVMIPRVIPFPEAPSFPILTEESGRLGLANVDEVLSQGSVPYWVVALVEVEGELFSSAFNGWQAAALGGCIE